VTTDTTAVPTCGTDTAHAPHPYVTGDTTSKHECPGAGALLASLEPGQWVLDGRFGPDPVPLEYVSAVFMFDDVWTPEVGGGPAELITVVVTANGIPQPFNLAADYYVLRPTREQIEQRRTAIKRQAMSDQLRKIADLILDPRLPLGHHETLLMDAGTVDRVRLHLIAGITGAPLEEQWTGKRGTTFYVTYGDTYPGAAIRWESTWAKDTVDVELPADDDAAADDAPAEQ
jgi:hypothetical protein